MNAHGCRWSGMFKGCLRGSGLRFWRRWMPILGKRRSPSGDGRFHEFAPHPERHVAVIG